MKSKYVVLLPTLIFLASCSGGSGASEMDRAIASVEAKVPGTDRASVRVCEEMILGGPMSSFADVLDFTARSLKELNESDDPKGMKNALAIALIEVGDAALVQDTSTYNDAAMSLATVCVDIVSGEYGK